MRYTINDESGGERFLKIGQHLPKIWAKIKVGVFYWTQSMKHKFRTNLRCRIIIPSTKLAIREPCQNNNDNYVK